MLKCLALAASALAGELHVLTDANFDEFISNNQRVLVKFYAPWCGHCKSMAPDYKAAAEEVDAEKMVFADVDATVEKKSAEKFGVQGFPTLKYFLKGEAVDYDGGRKKQDFLDWVEEVTGAAVTVGAPPEDLTKVAIILYHKELLPAFDEIASANRKAGKYFHVVSDDNKITMQHPNEDVQTLTKLEKDDIETFIKENKLPLVGELNGDTFETYSSSGTGLIWGLFNMEEGETVADLAKKNNELLRGIAEKHKGKYAVTYTDTKQFGQAIEGMLGVTADMYPVIVVQNDPQGKTKFIYDATEQGELTVENANKWIDDIAAGKVVAKLKSEPIPETQEDVKVVVGENLKEMIFSATKDVLFEVYAPWCGHCKKLEPEYETLASKVVRDIDDFVTIAKMDGTANDSPVESIEFSGFPTIFWIKAGSEEPEKYEGGRTAKDMWDHVKTKGNNADKILAALTEKYGETVEQHDEL